MENTTNIYRLYDPREYNITKYVGKTSSKLNTRLAEHISHSRITNYKVSNWISSLLKVGIRPKIELLDICYSEDWEFWEIFYISKYKSSKLTNIEKGGKSLNTRTYKKKAQDIRKVAVDMFDVGGNFIKTYESMASASREIGNSKENISAACRGNQTTSGGYVWRYHNNPLPAKDDLRCKQVNQFSLNGKFIKQYKSIKEASNLTGIFRTGIGSCCRGKYKSSGNYIWKYN